MAKPSDNAATNLLMTVSSLAEYLAVSHSTIYKVLRKGTAHLPFIKIGGEYRFDKAEIDRWIAEQQTEKSK